MGTFLPYAFPRAKVSRSVSYHGDVKQMNTGLHKEHKVRVQIPTNSYSEHLTVGYIAFVPFWKGFAIAGPVSQRVA